MYSQIGQDDIVVSLIQGKRDGTFVDIGCGRPVHINNTYLLEKDLNWTGISINWEGDDFVPSTEQEWKELRPQSKLIVADALKLNYSEIFKENNLPSTIDYLTLDLEPPEVTFETLLKLPLDDYIFNIVTYEHDGYRMGEEFKEKTRDYFKSHGYDLVTELNNQDDVYAHITFKQELYKEQK